jgi:hypothetical protein
VHACTAGLAKSVVLKSAGEEAWRSVCRVLRRRLERLPVQKPPPDDIMPSKDTAKVFEAAAKLQKDKGKWLGKMRLGVV